MSTPFPSDKRGLYTRIRRPLDYLYILFFLVHFLASVLIDAQILLPPSLFPASLRAAKASYLLKSQDPLLTHVSTSPSLRWFKTCVFLELTLQVPVFLLGAYELYRDGAGAGVRGGYACAWRVYPLLIAYATLASVTTLLSLVQALQGSSSSSSSSSSLSSSSSSSLSEENKTQILLAYGPFLLVPGVMLLDMLVRCHLLLLSRSSSNGGVTRVGEDVGQTTEMRRDKKDE